MACLSSTVLKLRQHIDANPSSYYWLADLHRVLPGASWANLSAGMAILGYRREHFASKINGHPRRRVCFVAPGARSPRRPVGRPRFNLLEALDLEHCLDGAYRPKGAARPAPTDFPTRPRRAPHDD